MRSQIVSQHSCDQVFRKAKKTLRGDSFYNRLHRLEGHVLGLSNNAGMILTIILYL